MSTRASELGGVVGHRTVDARPPTGPACRPTASARGSTARPPRATYRPSLGISRHRSSCTETAGPVERVPGLGGLSPGLAPLAPMGPGGQAAGVAVPATPDQVEHVSSGRFAAGRERPPRTARAATGLEGHLAPKSSSRTSHRSRSSAVDPMDSQGGPACSGSSSSRPGGRRQGRALADEYGRSWLRRGRLLGARRPGPHASCHRRRGRPCWSTSTAVVRPLRLGSAGGPATPLLLCATGPCGRRRMVLIRINLRLRRPVPRPLGPRSPTEQALRRAARAERSREQAPGASWRRARPCKRTTQGTSRWRRRRSSARRSA